MNYLLYVAFTCARCLSPVLFLHPGDYTTVEITCSQCHHTYTVTTQPGEKGIDIRA